MLEPGVRTGMPILYDEPEGRRCRPHRQRGRRAYDLYGGPTIVVDFGTANTVDAVSAKGEYLGGAIFPGIEISHGRACSSARPRCGGSSWSRRRT